jgi:hypothetical protein
MGSNLPTSKRNCMVTSTLDRLSTLSGNLEVQV